MKILITGGTGFIGSHVVHSLLKKNHELFILTRKGSSTWRIDDIIKNVTLLPFSSLNDIVKIIPNHIDGVLHLATLYKKKDDKESIEAMITANITIPSLVLHQAIRSRSRFFINTGTCFEYALSDSKLTEESSIEGYNFYAATKLAFEQLLKYNSSHSLIRTLTLRLFYPYGEKDNKKLMTILVDTFLNNKQLTASKGEQVLNFTYITDLVCAYEKAISYVSIDGNDQHEVFNIGTESPIGIRQIVAILEDLTGKKDLVTFGDSYPSNEIMHMNCDFTKASILLGWKPEYTIETGLRAMYEYYKSHPEHL